MKWAAWAGVVVGAGALVFAYLAWWVSRKQLRLAREQATLRPKIVASFKAVEFHPPLNILLPPPDPQAAIVFDLANNGRSAAHNVRCEFRFEEQHL
jgi:hypothetical protein